jgi:hypothetical protein
VFAEIASREKLASNVARANHMHEEAKSADTIASLTDEVKARDEQSKYWLSELERAVSSTDSVVETLGRFRQSLQRSEEVSALQS